MYRLPSLVFLIGIQYWVNVLESTKTNYAKHFHHHNNNQVHIHDSIEQRNVR